MRRLFIVADDLSGAADSAIACVQSGLSAMVTLGVPAEDAAADVLAIDANTRSVRQEDAAHRVDEVVRWVARSDAQPVMFKKLDSTLRGHAAAEIAAMLSAWRQCTRDHCVVVLAPAFPATGRTTADGHQMLHGMHLHETELGRHEKMSGPCDLKAMMSSAGLSSICISLAQVRGEGLQTEMQRAAPGVDVLVCDAETDDDLVRIASAAVTLGPRTIFAGSAGLAQHVPNALGLEGGRTTAAWDAIAGPVLFAIGSMSSVTRRQVDHLQRSSATATIVVEPQVLLDAPDSVVWAELQASIEASLNEGRDTAVVVSTDTLLAKSASPRIADGLGRLLLPCSHAGALVATGGETALAVLKAWGIGALRLVRTVEAGVPLSLAEAWQRPLPVITKAGAFGDKATLTHCLHALREGSVRDSSVQSEDAL